MKKNPVKICSECKINPLKCVYGRYSAYCIRCTYIVKRRNASEERAKNKEYKIIKDKKCEKCDKSFIPYSSNQKYCQNPCTSKIEISASNLNWINKEEKPYERRDENKVAYSFFRKKYGVKNKFNVCRG